MNHLHVRLSLFFLLLGSLFGQTQHSIVRARNDAPPQLELRGMLTGVAGKPLNGMVAVTFLVYKEEHGGAPVWLETQDVQADAAGHYVALLGSATAQGIPRNLIGSAEMYWISTQTLGQEESARAPYVLNGADLSADYNGQYSADWAGYAVTGTDFTLATGSWHVPEVNCTKTPNTFSLVWVGIDGFNPSGSSNATVEQIGTASNCSGTTPQYFAWYEFYLPPGIPRVVIQSVPVKAGDIIGAYVEYTVNSQGAANWTVWINDYTTNKNYSTQVPYNSLQKRSTAEWIVERPCCDADWNDEPLADFDKVNLGGYLTGVPGTNFAEDSSFGGNIGQFPSGSVYELTMAYPVNSKGTILAVPGALQGEGGSTLGSFQVSWKATGP